MKHHVITLCHPDHYTIQYNLLLSVNTMGMKPLLYFRKASEIDCVMNAGFLITTVRETIQYEMKTPFMQYFCGKS